MTNGKKKIFEIQGNNNLFKYKKPETSGYWDLTGGIINIDDTDPAKNWTYTATTYSWCNGSGTWNDPYIIENVTINANGANFGIKIENSNNKYFIIRNCSVSNSIMDAIRIHNSNNGMLSNNIIVSNYVGFYFRDCSNLTIEENTVEQSAAYGMYCLSTFNSTIRLNNLAKNQIGFELISCNDNAIIYNGIGECTNGAGIDLIGSDNNSIQTNIIRLNTGNGIYCSASEYNIIEDNTLLENINGIKLFESHRTEIKDNTIKQNNLDGVNLENSNYNTIIGNNISENIENGLYLSNSSNNDIFENSFIRNIQWGINLYLNSNDNHIRGNIIQDNGYGCILDWGLNNINEDNVCSGNIFIYFISWFIHHPLILITFIVGIVIGTIGIAKIIRKHKKKLGNTSSKA